MAWFSWSQTAASNSNADGTINWAEGQAPSSINDSARAMMAASAKYRDDIAGAIVTGGAATAYTVASYSSFDTLAHLNGQIIAFTPHATSTNAVGVDVTLNVDGLGAKAIRMQPGVALPGGTLILGTPYMAVYNSSDAVFYLHNMINPYAVPLAGGMDFWGSTAPNSSFAFPTGQAISRTTYATLFSLISTTYGTGDGSTTFNLPDKTGRISAMKEASASRLTSTYFGGNSTALGATGGLESNTLTTATMPSHTHTQQGTFASGTMSANASHSHSYFQPVSTGNPSPLGAGQSVSNASAANTNSVGIDHTHNTTISGATTSIGSDGAHNNVQPTIVCNYIMRII